MAVSYETATSSGAGTTNTHTTGNITIGANSNPYLLVGVSWWDSFATDYSASCKWGGSSGTSLTQVGTNIDHTSGSRRGAVFELKNPTPQTSTIYVLLTGTVTRISVAAISCYGVDQTTPLGTADILNNLETSSPTTGSVILSSNGLLVGFLLYTEGDTITPGGSQTQRAETENSNASISVDTRASTGTFTWTTTGAFDRAITWAAPMNEAAAASGTILSNWRAMQGGLVNMG